MISLTDQGFDPGPLLSGFCRGRAETGAVASFTGLARASDPVGQDLARGVGGLITGVGDAEDGDADRDQGLGLVDLAPGGEGGRIHGRVLKVGGLLAF